MSKKLFTFIRGGDIHTAPETKVIPAEAFSTLLEAQDVSEQVRKDAALYRIEVAEQCEKIKEEAYKEGFEHGYAEWVKKITELELEIIRVHEDTQKMIVPVALKAAKKIVGRELETRNTAVVDIIVNSLKAVAQHKKIKIFVNKKDYESLEKNRDRIKDVFENLEALSIIPQDNVATGGCIIETESGIMNAQLENLWMILENAVQKLALRTSPVEHAGAKQSGKE